MSNSFVLLALASLAGLGLGAILVVREQDQRRRDADRKLVVVRLPRGLRPEQVLALVRTVIGLASPAVGLVGRDSVVFEALGTGTEIVHRLRLPASASTYLVAQLRAIVPGVAVEETDSTRPWRCRAAVELRRQITPADLVVSDAAAVSRTILAALTELHRGETAVWQVVVGGGIGARPAETGSLWQRLTGTTEKPSRPATDSGVISVTMRLGAMARTDRRARALVSRLRRAAGSVSAPQARLVPRRLPGRVVAGRIARAATPITHAAILLRPEELVALVGWPLDSPVIAGLSLGGSPQLPAAVSVPTTGRVLGRSTVTVRRVAMSVAASSEHSLVLGPTGSGKSWLVARLMLDDIAAGRGGLLVDPKGGSAQTILDRYPENAIGRTVVIDPTDSERPVPVPLLTAEAGGVPELAADNLIALLRHRYRDLGPRSTDILASSLYALGRMPNASVMDLLRLWGDPAYRTRVMKQISDDPVLVGFFIWFDSLGTAERSAMLAAPLNKIRPLLQRPMVRNVIAAPRPTFTLAEAFRERLVVIVRLPEGELGSDATSLLGQVIISRLWSATQARRERSFFSAVIEEAPRFLDQPTDLGDILTRSREYSVGLTIVAQALGLFPPTLRETVLNSARTKVAFGTSAGDARRLAAEFGGGVEADHLVGLRAHEAIGAVSLRGAVSPPFSFATDALGPVIPGRAAAVRAASRARFGVPKAEIEVSFTAAGSTDRDATGPVGRRRT